MDYNRSKKGSDFQILINIKICRVGKGKKGQKKKDHHTIYTSDYMYIYIYTRRLYCGIVALQLLLQH